MKFKIKKIGQICSLVTDYVANGSFKSLADNVKYLEKGYARVIRLVDFKNNYKENDSIWVEQQAYEFLGKSKLFGEEIILTNVGANLGTVFLAPKLDYPMTLGPNAIMIKTNEECNDKFLYYWLKSKIGQRAILNIVTGSAMPKFNKTDFKNIEIEIPSKINQEKIVGILTCIDKKITENNKINNSLLQIGIKLFNKELNNSNDIQTLENVIKFVKGKKPKDISEVKHKNYEKYLTIACLNSQELNYANTTKMVMANNNLLMVMDGASSGDVYYGGKGIVGSTLARIDCIDNNYSSEFIYFVMKYYKELIQSKNTGSAIPHTDKVFVSSLEIPKITCKEQEKYKVILANIQNNIQENQTLKQLRNELLPKLMNGEIDLENIV